MKAQICHATVSVLAFGFLIGIASLPSRGATYNVISNADGGPGTLRQAILDANANDGTDLITFAIGTGPVTISPQSPLPAITGTVSIDGATQPGFSGNPIVELSGSSAGSSAGLEIQASNCTVRGLVVNHFQGDGILLNGSSGTAIKGCFIGVSESGTAAAANAQHGVEVHGSNNTVGGTNVGDANVISGNGDTGVVIADNSSTENSVVGDLIGLDSAGSHSLPNVQWGVRICCGASRNTIGGLTPGSGNVISGNSSGILISDGGTTGNTIRGNYIGTDASGKVAIGNQYSGVYVCCSAVGTIIGGTAPEARNVICGNGQSGNDAVVVDSVGTTGTVIQGNYIGVDATGKAALANQGNNVSITGGATNSMVGGSAAGAGNVISASANANGVQICGSGTGGNIVAGNFIGTDSTGLAKLPNKGVGVHLCDGATANTIGGVSAAARNVISGNSGAGVAIDGRSVTLNTVAGNYIGVDTTGKAALPNSQGGVNITSGASNNTIGGSVPGARNVISGNIGDGVTVADLGTSLNVVAGNYIGVDVSGLAKLSNANTGLVLARGATSNVIGGAVSGAGNVISGAPDNNSGIYITDTGTSQNVVAGDLIGTDATGAAALPNAQYGVFVANGAAGNIIGGTAPEARNIISGNGSTGVRIESPGSNSNLIRGNYIGLDISGAHALPNAFRGIDLADGPVGTIVGGDVAGAGNVISGNLDTGIVVEGVRAVGTVIQGNYIGTDATGRKAVGNASSGVAMWGGSTKTLVGGSTALARNVIAGNSVGVMITDSGTADNAVRGNYIGVDASGSAPLGNVNEGVNIQWGAQNNSVGGLIPGAGNLISANAVGVALRQPTTAANVVQGNLLGTDFTGLRRMGNGYAGVEICCGASGNTIGGLVPGARNVIADSSFGVHITDPDTNVNVVQGNFIGTDITGAVGMNCGTDAIDIVNGASRNIIGGTADGAGNVLYWSNRNGVTVEGTPAPTGNTISRNSIYGNAGLGIDLGADGVTRNRAGGPFSGPNLLQNAPVITVASFAAGSATISGKLNSAPNATFSIELFSNPSAHASGYGEGRVFLKTVIATTDSAGNATFSTVAPVPPPVGSVVSATATDAAGNTSEFSAAFPLAGAPVNPALVVTNTNDSGPGSLRQAIMDANAHTGSDRIEFNIAQGGPAVIYPNGSLPTITDSVVIDGSTQPGYLGRPLIAIIGWSSGDSDGLAVSAGQATFNALCISAFNRNGINLLTSGNTVSGCWLGTDPTGQTAYGNNRSGVHVATANNSIGGAGAGMGNVISGCNTGVDIDGSGATGNTVVGNLIGPDPSGTIAVPNNRGILIENSAAGNTVGGVTPASRNVISGNYGIAVEITGTGTSANVLRGNFIGTDITGAAPLTNGDAGVYIHSASTANIVGGTAAGAGNVISGNGNHGVSIRDSGTDGNIVQGNSIGTNLGGTAAISNVNSGIAVEEGPLGTIVGGTVPGARNLVSGNRDRGILFGNASNGTIQGNYVGVDATGTKALPNETLGIHICCSSNNTVVGGTTAGAGNLVSGNNSTGIGVWDGTDSGTIIQGNLVGTDLTGTLKIPNGYDGIAIGGGALSTTVGGTAPGSANLSSGNNAGGITMSGDTASGTVVQGNYVGTDVTGTKPLGNGQNGVLICCGAHDNTIGGTAAAARNIVCSNATGVSVQTAHNNTIEGNFIGVDATGLVALGNQYDGMLVCCSSANNSIGGSVTGAGNVIAANGANGITINDDGTTGNTFYGNFIGTDAGAAVNLGNARNGVQFNGAASGNTLGGVLTGMPNVIANSGDRGVALPAVESVHNAFRGNHIYGSATLGIDLANDGVTPNHAGGSAAGPNNFLNYPVLTTAKTTGTSLIVSGTYPGGPSTTYAVDFYASPTAHATGFGEGQTYLGNATVTTDATGSAPFIVTLPVVVTPGWVVSATATDAAKDTSEFSRDVTASVYQPVLAVSGSSIDDSAGNNNGVVDFNECVSLTITVANTGNRAATGITSTLSTTTAGVTITSATSPVPDILEGTSKPNTSSFKVSVSPAVACGTPVAFNLKIVAAEGTFNVPLTITTGAVGAPVVFRAAGPATIPDGDFAGVDIPITVSGMSAPIASVAASVYVTHTYDSDLAISLVAPDGTTIYLSTGNGGSGHNYGASCPAETGGTTFDDGAAVSITAGAAPFAGSFRPQQPLSALIGKSGTAVNGVWKLHVADVVAPDSGAVQCCSLSIKPRVCQDGGGQCAGTTLYGDANGDSQVNASDVVALLRAAGGLSAVPVGGVTPGDVAPKPSALPSGFGDGKWTIIDAVRVIRHLKGLDNTWP